MLLLLALAQSLTYDRTYTNVLPAGHFHLAHTPIIVRRTSPQILFSAFSNDENSLDEESEVQNDREKEEGVGKRMRRMIGDVYEGMTMGRIVFFVVWGIVFVLVGYQIRKREEQSNYVRLPNTD